MKQSLFCPADRSDWKQRDSYFDEARSERTDNDSDWRKKDPADDNRGKKDWKWGHASPRSEADNFLKDLEILPDFTLALLFTLAFIIITIFPFFTGGQTASFYDIRNWPHRNPF